jgi:hypothetical protein
LQSCWARVRRVTPVPHEGLADCDRASKGAKFIILTGHSTSRLVRAVGELPRHADIDRANNIPGPVTQSLQRLSIVVADTCFGRNVNCHDVLPARITTYRVLARSGGLVGVVAELRIAWNGAFVVTGAG